MRDNMLPPPPDCETPLDVSGGHGDAQNCIYHVLSLHHTILCINWSITFEVCPIFAPLPPAPDCYYSDGRNLLISWLNWFSSYSSILVSIWRTKPPVHQRSQAWEGQQFLTTQQISSLPSTASSTSVGNAKCCSECCHIPTIHWTLLYQNHRGKSCWSHKKRVNSWYTPPRPFVSFKPRALASMDITMKSLQDWRKSSSPATSTSLTRHYKEHSVPYPQRRTQWSLSSEELQLADDKQSCHGLYLLGWNTWLGREACLYAPRYLQRQRAQY